MNYSGQPGHRARVGALVLLDVLARLMPPAALLALAHGWADLTLFSALVLSVVSGLRGFVMASTTAASLDAAWRTVIDAARRRPVMSLRLRREDEESVAMLIEAIRESALHAAVSVPQLASVAITLAIVAAAVAWLVGPAWLLLGLAVLGVAGGVVAAIHRRLRGARERAWSGFAELSRDLRVLVDACTELRANGREERFTGALLGDVERTVRGERAASLWSAVIQLLPVTIAIAAIAAPVKAGVHSMAAALGPGRIADAFVLGASGVLLGLSLVSAVETALASGPQRRALAEFLARSGAATEGGSSGARPGTSGSPIFGEEIALDAVSFRYPGATVDTPETLGFRWPARQGLALLGPNGAGKSTIALMLLGLLRPTGGEILVGGERRVLAAEGAPVAYLPQGAFVAPGSSVAWHLRLLAPDASDEAIDACLERVGLGPVLAAHARRRGAAAREVPAGELSGGERQRLLLARLLLQDADLVVLDEPEVGLDAAGRAWLRGLLEELAATRRVLVIAHDETVIPAAFARLRCGRSEPRMGAPGAPGPAAARASLAGGSC